VIYVYHHIDRTAAAAALAERLRAEGHVVQVGSGRFVEAVPADAVAVYADGSCPAACHDSESRGLTIHPLETTPPEAARSVLRVVESSPGWWKVLDASGAQVGPAKRFKADAEELRREMEALDG
jgi:hypothetical protein